MDLMNLEKDYEYFKKLWEYRRPGGIKHTAEIWNVRAKSWEKELECDNLFRRQMDDRVDSAAKFLRNRGLLQAGSTVVDIGCGPGRFVVEFAKTAGHATGIDISLEMLKLGEKQGKEKGVSNISFTECDFKNTDIDSMGWRNKFDLVFTSMSPGTGDESGLDKIMGMSRAFCFNCSPIYGEDLLENQIARDVFGMEKNPRSLWDQRWFYSLFNILWIRGYLPETYYHTQETEEAVDADERLLSYYSGFFSKEFPEKDVIESKIRDYIKSRADESNKIYQKSKRVYGWILWDVRQNMKKD